MGGGLCVYRPQSHHTTTTTMFDNNLNFLLLFCLEYFDKKKQILYARVAIFGILLNETEKKNSKKKQYPSSVYMHFNSNIKQRDREREGRGGARDIYCVNLEIELNVCLLRIIEAFYLFIVVCGEVDQSGQCLSLNIPASQFITFDFDLKHFKNVFISTLLEFN